MEKLKAKVQELEKTHDKKKQIHILQDINNLLLTEYEIRIGEHIIEPLLVEAYYYNEATGFDDDSVHAANKIYNYELAKTRQKNHFGELYVHKGTKDGLDIVLSDGDYYLSFLIKNALIDNDFAQQCAVSETLCGKCKHSDTCNKGKDCHYYGIIVLKHKDNKDNSEIVFTKRKGLGNDYKDLCLAALPIDKIKDYDFTPGERPTEIVRHYINEQLKAETYDEKRLKDLAAGLIDWNNFKGESS